VNAAQIIFTNGKILTVDPKDTVAEAVAVSGNRIVAVGRPQEMERLRTPDTRTVDLAGRTLLPGFNDAHAHPGYYGAVRLQMRCGPNEMSSIEELKAEVRKRAQQLPKGEWILGRGYDEKRLTERRHPTRYDLDEAAPEHLVFVTRTCGHVSAANSLVLRKFGISGERPDPPGGRIQRDDRGEPTGVLFEKAHYPIRMASMPSYQDLGSGLQITNDYFLSLGITSATDCSGRNPEEIHALQRAIFDGWFKVRIYFMVRTMGETVDLGEHYLNTGLVSGFGNERLRLGPYKAMLDGAGSAGSAAMRLPYPNNPDNYGILHMSAQELEAQVMRGHQAGWQVAVHAIGDRAIDITLDAFEKALRARPREDHRHRIEHCGFLDDRMLDRMASLGVMAGLGLPFLYELGDSYIESYGLERLQRAYPLKSMVERGIKAPLSSDAPVMDPNPMHGLYCAIARKAASGREIGPAEKVDLKTAVRAYTLDGAYGSFEENLKGSIEIGKLADLVVLSDDLLSIAPEEILNLKVDMTMVDGEIVYERSDQ
jgi:predicted amidohydrolase YtcJ